MCREHPDENLNYYCFDCNCECICCECIVHGVHRDHNVANITKAAPLI